MDGTDRDSAGTPGGGGAAGVGVSAAGRGPARWLGVLCATAVALALCGSPALASAGDAHVFASSFIGEGKCALKEPGDMAVNDVSRKTYLYDAADNSINVFSSAGACVEHKKVNSGATGEPGYQGVALDNSGGASAGDLYVAVLGEKGPEVRKYEQVGESLKAVASIRKASRKEGKEVVEEVEAFEEIHGIAVDAHGNLWVYQGEQIDEINGNVAGATGELITVLSVESPNGCLPRPGFAMSSDATSFYVGRERENRTGGCEAATVLTKLNGSGEPASEPAYTAQLDNENTTGAAVDAKTGDVYFDNATSVSAFTSGGVFIDRFGNEASAGSGKLVAGAGVAVEPAANDVYVADAHEGKVEVFEPDTSQQAPPTEPGGEPKPKLPDGRAWELVSPTSKLAASIYPITPESGIVQAAEDGSAITYTATAPIVSEPAVNRSFEPFQNLSRRGSSAWGTQGISTPAPSTPAGLPASGASEYEYFSSDLSTAFVYPAFHSAQSPTEGLLAKEASESTPYTRTLTTASSACEPTPSSCYRALVSPLDDTTGVAFASSELSFMSATPDARHAVLHSVVPLTPTAKQEEQEDGLQEGLYEWESNEAGGALQLVSVLPADEAEEGRKLLKEAEEAAGPGALNELTLGGPSDKATGGMMRNAISSVGSRIIWSTGDGLGNSPTGSRLYLRDTVKHETIRLDKAQKGIKQPEGSHAVFQTASADGSKIFFTDVSRLTPESSLVEGAEAEETELEQRGSEGDLYECEVVEEPGLACRLRDLTAEVGSQNETAEVQGVLGASEDGSDIYYVANGVLAKKNAGHGDCARRGAEEKAAEQEGKLPVLGCNLYLDHFNGEKWETRWLARLTSEDAPDWTVLFQKGALGSVTSRVSPNGNYVAFMSNSPLTHYNNVDASSGKRDEEVFLYAASSDRLLCASCNPDRSKQPAGVLDKQASGEGKGLLIDRPKIWDGRYLAANIPGWTARSESAAVYQSRYLSDSGRLFFNSADPLVEAAKNGKADVYEYEPDGEGACTSATGCIGLISSGTSKQESTFLDSSVSGHDVFFLTAAPLLEQDQDTNFDIYDARGCTATSPCFSPPKETRSECAEKPGEGTCKAPATSAPALPGVPPSASYSGPGNIGRGEVLGATAKGKSSKTLTRAQKLKKALKACKKLKKRAKRNACEKQAHKKYDPLKKKKGKSSRRAQRGGR
jgi:DNA-binding beta-propeller fold protein YncE